MSARLEGVILRKKILRDNDLLLSVFSLSDGRIKLVQKRGCKKPQAALDLFCRNEFVVAENKDFAVIYQTTGLELFAQIRQNYALLQNAAEAVKIVEKITSSLQPNAGLYQILVKYLQTLNSPIDTATLPALKLELCQNILRNEGIYDGKKVTEKSFWLALANYSG
jgi:DNA repair protein RecO